jgi:DNA-directed RNA polymerase subunit RPC12/RpoP
VAELNLHCPNGCEGGVFEALNAPVLVDRAGRYLRHRTEAATYVCAVCQSVAVDLASAAREMRRRTQAAPMTLCCPACGLEMLPPEDDPFADLLECPACETRFGIEEGMRSLHGGGRDTGDGDGGATPGDNLDA